MQVQGRRDWSSDILTIDGEIWQSILEQVPLVSISPTQRLSQLFVIHRVHRNPLKLFKWHCREVPDCPRCGDSIADHLHMFWTCRKLVIYWNTIISVINQAFQVSLQNDSLTCVLGFLDEELFTPHVRKAITRLLYLARNCILLKWIAPSLLSLRSGAPK